MCETASAVSSMSIGGVTATTNLQFAAVAATAAVSSISDTHPFNVITTRNTAIKNFNTNSNSSKSLQYTYTNQPITTNSVPTTPIIRRFFTEENILSKTIIPQNVDHRPVLQQTGSVKTEKKTCEVSNYADRIPIQEASCINKFCSLSVPPSGFSTIINESDFPHLGVRWSPSLSGATNTIDSLSASSVNNTYGNATLSMHGGLVPSSTSAIISQQQTSSLQNALFNRESGVHLNRPYANLIRDSISLNSASNEFRIHNEDFPALPANTQLSVSLKGGDVLNQELNSSEQEAQFSEALGIRNLHQGPNLSDTTLAAKGGIQTHADGLVTNIPAIMLNDQYGMAGLLTFLRTLENDPSIVALALGQDLTNLGLNLNSPKYRNNLHQTFGGPWSDYPPRMQDLDIKVPGEYMTNLNIRDKLPNIKLNKFGDDVLFYLFYNCPGEVYQSAAAWELYQRDWRYHKLDRVWLTRSPFNNPSLEHTGNYEKASYHIFDPVQWRKIPKEIILDYKELEGRPYLPSAMAPHSSTLSLHTNNINTPAGMTPRGMMETAMPSLAEQAAFAAAQQQQRQQQQQQHQQQQQAPFHTMPLQSQAHQQLGQMVGGGSGSGGANGVCPIGMENMMEQITAQRK